MIDDLYDGIYYVGPDKRYGKKWNRLRHIVFNRDNYICQECGIKCDRSTPSRTPNCHHIIPLGKGGTNHYSNLITLCRRCHKKLHGLK
jgi:5-methylcytosine-specific restriction enzyme A